METNEPIQDNRAFLQRIAADIFPGLWVCQFPWWGGGFATDKLDRFTIDDATYVAAATIAPGSKSRNDATADAGWLIVLDDVGTKMDIGYASYFAPDPTYRIETSDGNEQWGYRISPVETDMHRWHAFYELLRETAWKPACDNSGLAAYKRLPFGKASKADKKGFETRLVALDASRSYSLDELAAAFGIDLSPESVARVAAPSRNVSEAVRPGEEAEDLLWSLFDHIGALKSTRPKDSGWWDAVCPWQDEHTRNEKTGAAILPFRMFKCNHTHCTAKTPRDVFNHYIANGEGDETRDWLLGRMFPDLTEPEKEEVERKAEHKEELVEANLLAELRHRLPAHAKPYLVQKKFDARAFEDDRDERLIVRPTILPQFYRDVMTMLAAKPGAGKSALMVNVALSIAYETDRLLGMGRPDWTGDIVIVSNEDSRNELRRRILAAERFFGLDPADKKHEIHIIASSKIKIAAMHAGVLRRSYAPLLRHMLGIAEDKEIAMVILDTFSSAVSGINENDNNQMQTVMDYLDEFSKASFASFAVIHHISKAGANGGADDMYASRGASSIVGAVRSQVILSSPTQEERDQYGWTKPGDASSIVRLGHGKNNYAAGPGDRAMGFMRWNDVELEAVDPRDGSIVMQRVGVLSPIKPVRVTENAALLQKQFNAIAEAIKGLPAGRHVRRNTRSAIDGVSVAQVLGLPEKQAWAAVDALAQMGLLRCAEVTTRSRNSAQIIELVENIFPDDLAGAF